MNAEATLIPTEVILLNAEKFAEPRNILSKLNSELLPTGVRVSKVKLMEATLAAAFLANEEAGSIRLQIRTKHSGGGRRTVSALFADPTTVDGQWPDRTLEAEICRLLQEQRAGQQLREVENIICALLTTSAPDPYLSIVDLVINGLVARALLQLGHAEAKWLGVFPFKKSYYIIPDDVASLARPLEVGVQKLLSNCQKDRPQIWHFLIMHTQKAMWRLTELDLGDDV